MVKENSNGSARQPVAQIAITLFSDGSCGVQTAVANKVQAYGMLEMAKEVFQKSQSQAEPSRITVPTLTLKP